MTFQCSAHSLDEAVIVGKCADSDCRIVYVNEVFLNFTQFDKSDVMGKSVTCNFLYGADTRPEHVNRIKAATETRAAMKASLVLYRKSGES